MNRFKKKQAIIRFFCLVFVLLGTSHVHATILQIDGKVSSVVVPPLEVEDEIPGYLIATEHALNKGQFKSVLGMSQKILALQSDNVSAQALLGAAYTGLGDQKSAKGVFEQIRKSNPGDFSLYSYQARVYRIIGKLGKAEQLYKDGIKNSTEKTKLRMLLADLYGEQKKFEETSKLFEKVLEQKIVIPKDYLNASFALCRIDLQLQRYDRVVKRAKELIASYPPIPQGYTFLATAYLKKDKPKQAVAVYEALIHANPKISEPYQELALIYKEQLADDSKALQYAKKAVEEFPANAKSLDVLGWVLFRSNKFDQAVRQFQAAIQLAPEQAVYYYHLGLAQLQMKKNKSAKKSFVEALNRISQKEAPAFAAELKKRIRECG